MYLQLFQNGSSNYLLIQERVRSIIAASKQRGDKLHTDLDLEIRLENNPELTVQCHKSCVSSYTSKVHILRSLRKLNIHNQESTESLPLPSRYRSTLFDFRLQCLICGEVCLPIDPKNPSRWMVVVKCRTAYRPGRKTFKEVLLEKCEERGDAISSGVRLRISGAHTDLHAADAQYHRMCYTAFMNCRNISTWSENAYFNQPAENDDISPVTIIIKENLNRV